MNIIIVDMRTRMYVEWHLQVTFLTVITVAHICVRVVTTSITVSVHVVFSLLYQGNSLGIVAG